MREESAPETVEGLEMNESSCNPPNSVTKCCSDGTAGFLRMPKLAVLGLRRGRG